MASGLSHILITQKVIDECQYSKLKNYISGSNRGLVYLGAVCPDLPYLSILDGSLIENETFLADLFHYTHTDQLVLEGLARIKTSVQSKEIRAAQFALISGFASHVIVDGVFHPFIRDKVGDYNAGNQKNHRILEMKLDVLLTRKLYGLNLNSSGLQDTLTQYKSSKHYTEALQLFFDLIGFVYGREPDYISKQDQISLDKIYGWIDAIHRSLDFAEGEFPLFYRKLLMKMGLGYGDYNDIDSEQDKLLNLELPIDAKTHGLNDNFLQQGRRVNFFDDVYPRCLSQVSSFWESAFKYVFEDGEIPNFDPINLDNGRLLSKSHLTEIPHYWRA